MRDDALVQHGLPIKPAFWKGETRSAAALRGTLGLDQDAPTVLVVGGGDGVGAIETNAKAIGAALGASAAPRQMVVVCGKNAKARERLAKHKWAPGVSVKVEGFVNNMDECVVRVPIIASLSVVGRWDFGGTDRSVAASTHVRQRGRRWS